jgi:site-specific recombinase XerD
LRNSQKVRWGELTRPGKETLSPASVASYGRVVKVFFAWLITEGYIDDDPFAGKGVSFNTKHKEARVVKVVDAGDLEKIFNYLMNSNRLQYYNGPRNLAIIALLTDSGIRRGELLGLKVDDFDLENNRCMVSGKTGERWVHFSEACRVAIKGYFNMREIWHQGIYPEMWLTDESHPLGYHGFSVMITRLSKGHRRQLPRPLAAPYFRHDPRQPGHRPLCPQGSPGPRFDLDHSNLCQPEHRDAG